MRKNLFGILTLILLFISTCYITSNVIAKHKNPVNVATAACDWFTSQSTVTQSFDSATHTFSLNITIPCVGIIYGSCPDATPTLSIGQVVSYFPYTVVPVYQGQSNMGSACDHNGTFTYSGSYLPGSYVWAWNVTDGHSHPNLGGTFIAN